MTSMKDQTFGVEVEMVLSREKAAQVIAAQGRGRGDGQPPLPRAFGNRNA